MPLYTFYLCDHDATPYTFEAAARPEDSEACRTAGVILEQHPRAHFVAIWAGERPVLARHRTMPFVREVEARQTRREA